MKRSVIPVLLFVFLFGGAGASSAQGSDSLKQKRNGGWNRVLTKNCRCGRTGNPAGIT